MHFRPKTTPPASVSAVCHGLRAAQECALTLRSSRRTTAWRLGRAALWFIFGHAAQAPRRCARLSSNVRRRHSARKSATQFKVYCVNSSASATSVRACRARAAGTPSAHCTGNAAAVACLQSSSGALHRPPPKAACALACRPRCVFACGRCAFCVRAAPNWSLNRTPTGKTRWPRSGPFYLPFRGQRALPAVAA